jgi:teichoic acid transport system ATP-binding protein
MKSEIKIKDLTFNYLIPDEKNLSLKSIFINFFKTKLFKKYTVLKNFNLEIYNNDRIALVGKNGTGKSTLAKIIDGVYKVDKDQLKIIGNIYALYEPYSMLNNEFNASENIRIFYSNHNYSIKKILKIEKVILNFCDFDQKFINLPLKYYSSGMITRLVISLYVFLKMKKPYTFIIDEAFAFADIHFKKKVLSKINNKISQSNIFIMVSHDFDLIKKYCNKAVLIKDKKNFKSGTVDKIQKIYEKI